MRKMFSKKQIQNMTLNYIEGFDEIELDGDLIVNGDISPLENIVDSKGHKRFIGGEGTPAEISGITSNYCKWALSGNHLMLVYFFNSGESDISLAANQELARFTLPEWIMNQIVAALTNIVTWFNAYDSSAQTLPLVLRKGDTSAVILMDASKTFYAGQYCRIICDLIIE